MLEAKEDFWPDEIPDPADTAPVALLKEQGAILGQKTRGELEGVVRTSTENGTVFYSLYLKADALGDYLYKLLYIAHPAISRPGDDYPITAQSADGGLERIIKSDDEFRGWLRAQLSSEYVRSALGNLMRYIRERQSSRVG